MCSALRTAILCREVYMSELKMIAPAVPNVPWQDKPEGHRDRARSASILPADRGEAYHGT